MATLPYMSYEGFISANLNGQKLGVYDWGLEGSHSTLHLYFAKYVAKQRDEHVPMHIDKDWHQNCDQ